MRTIVEEYGMFMIASLSFFALMLVLMYFNRQSGDRARSFVAALTGSNQPTLCDWDTWGQ